MEKDNSTNAAERLRYLILAAERQGGRIFQEEMKRVGITGSQAEVIQVLEERGPLSLKELGALLICESGSPSRLVDRLVQEELLIRETNPKDSRYVVLRLSEKGHEKARIVKDVEREIYAAILQKLSIEKIENINDFISELLTDEPIAFTLKTRGFLSSK